MYSGTLQKVKAVVWPQLLLKEIVNNIPPVCNHNLLHLVPAKPRALKIVPDRAGQHKHKHVGAVNILCRDAALLGPGPHIGKPPAASERDKPDHSKASQQPAARQPASLTGLVDQLHASFYIPLPVASTVARFLSPLLSARSFSSPSPSRGSSTSTQPGARSLSLLHLLLLLLSLRQPPTELRLRHRPPIARSGQTRHPSSHLSPLLSVAQR
ncbi:uncharacterized protein BKA78DRAFT_358172 [Phyllosticta capitalensis]|uniref:Uncharacterized protein n=1 Tax=Phyllosticta capitalensis TaxID=121624 RepID=A0ABR1Z1E6_9PEZI